MTVKFDRLQVEDGLRATAVRNVPSTLPIFDSHFPRFPVLPGVLLLKSMAAVAIHAAGGDWRLRSAHTIRFRHFVRPGDQVVITATLTRRSGDVAEATASAQVEGTVVATVRRLVLEAKPCTE